MKKMITLSLLALPMALFLALAFTSISISTKVHAADAASVSDAQFVDGNWFAIAESKGEAYKVGSATQVALQAQLDLYQAAVEEKNLVDEEKYAIRSWVKGWVSAEIGLQALEKGDLAGAKAALLRAKAYGKTAQKAKAGLGETESRVNDDSAPSFGGTSAVEGKRVVAYASKYLAKVSAKLGETAADAE